MSTKTLTRLSMLLIVLGVMRWAVPGDGAGRPDMAAVAQAADASYETGSYKAASRGYRDAFALLDPVDDGVAPLRAVLAIKAARALVGWALELGPDADYGENVLWTADRWLDVAIGLDPQAGWTYYERAILFDADNSPLRDPKRALNGYRAFLGWVQTGDHEGEPNPPDPAGPQVARARQRMPELEALLGSPR